MKTYDISVYVGCSLTHASPEFRDSVEELKRRLSKVCRVLSFKGLSNENLPYDVYVHDILGCVDGCDLLLAICDYPSTGLGYELAVQAERKRGPVLAVAQRDALVTKLILDPHLPGYEFARYDNFLEDVFNLVIAKIEKMLPVAISS